MSSSSAALKKEKNAWLVLRDAVDKYQQVTTNEQLEEAVAAMEKPLLQMIESQRALASSNSSSSSSLSSSFTSSSSSSSSSSSAATSTSSSSPSQSLAALSSWLSTHVPACGVDKKWRFTFTDSDGIGLQAITDLAIDELFLSIPRSLCLTSRSCLSSEVGRLLASDTQIARIPSLLLALTLLLEKQKGAGSFWFEYIQTLPARPILDGRTSNGSTRELALPMFLPSKELKKLLQASPCYFDILQLQRSTTREYTHVYNLLKKKGWLDKLCGFDYEEFRWAVGTVMARQNRIPAPNSKDGQQQFEMALIPGWDMCNHRGSLHGRITTFFDVETDCSQSFTIEHVSANSPIHLFYGHRANSKLFIFQGFVDTQHYNDRYEWTLTENTVPALAQFISDPLWKVKCLLLNRFLSTLSAFHESQRELPPLHSQAILNIFLNPFQIMLTLPLPDNDEQFIEQLENRMKAKKSAWKKGREDSAEEIEEELTEKRIRRAENYFRWNAVNHLLRIVVANKEEINDALKRSNSHADKGNDLDSAQKVKHAAEEFGYYPLSSNLLLSPLSSRNELAVVSFVHNSLKHLLNSYGSSIADDEQILKQFDAKQKLATVEKIERDAVTMRWTEKKMIEIEMNKVEKRIEQMTAAAAASCATVDAKEESKK